MTSKVDVTSTFDELDPLGTVIDQPPKCACVSNDRHDCARRRYNRPLYDDSDPQHMPTIVENEPCECSCHDEWDEAFSDDDYV